MRTVKVTRGILKAVLVVTALVYPGFMGMMSAAGWLYNVREGNYEAIFRSFSGWMIGGGVLVLAAVVLVMAGGVGKRWRWSVAAAVLAAAGGAACMSALYRFIAYADAHFSAIDGTMQPVSELYRDRLLPILLPAALAVGIAVWQILDDESREWRIREKRERDARENAPAPKIVDD